MILLFYLTVASAVHTRIWHGDFTLRAYDQPDTGEIMHRIESRKWLDESYFREYFEFVSDKWYVRLRDIETSLKG